MKPDRPPQKLTATERKRRYRRVARHAARLACDRIARGHDPELVDLVVRAKRAA